MLHIEDLLLKFIKIGEQKDYQSIAINEGRLRIISDYLRIIDIEPLDKIEVILF